MLNYVWLALVLLAVAIGGWNDHLKDVTTGALDGAKTAVTIALGLIGIMALWLGVMRLAERAGLVSRVVPAASLLEEAMEAASTIASFSLPAVMMAKESVNRAYESTLAEGVHFERRLFHSLFATEDQKEGMAAFVEKRKPVFKHR